VRRSVGKDRGCPTGKVRYRDRASAQYVLSSLGEPDKRRRVSPNRIYQCHLCNGWHLTSQEEGE